MCIKMMRCISTSCHNVLPVGACPVQYKIETCSLNNNQMFCQAFQHRNLLDRTPAKIKLNDALKGNLQRLAELNPKAPPSKITRKFVEIYQNSGFDVDELPLWRSMKKAVQRVRTSLTEDSRDVDVFLEKVEHLMKGEDDLSAGIIRLIKKTMRSFIEWIETAKTDLIAVVGRRILHLVSFSPIPSNASAFR